MDTNSHQEAEGSGLGPATKRARWGGICGQLRMLTSCCMWLLYVLSTKLDGTCHTDCSVCGSRFGVLSIGCGPPFYIDAM